MTEREGDAIAEAVLAIVAGLAVGRREPAEVYSADYEAVVRPLEARLRA